MEEIKLTNTGADPIQGSDPVSVKTKEQSKETDVTQKVREDEKDQHVKPKQETEKRKPAKELSVASFVMRSKEEAPEASTAKDPKDPQRKKKKKNANETTVDRAKVQKQGPSVLKKEKGKSEEVKKKRKKRKRPPQETDESQNEQNMPKNPKKKKISLRAILARLILLLILLSVIGVAVLMNMFRLHEIRVTGNRNFTKEQIIEMTGIPSDAGNTMLTYLRFKDVTGNDKPLIKYLRVSMIDRNTLGIDVAETAVVGQILYRGSFFCFDDGGYIEEINNTRDKNVPMVTGIDIADPQIGQIADTGDPGLFSNIAELCQRMTERSIGVDEIAVEDDGALMIYIDDNIRINFGSCLLMESKVSEIAGILPELIRMEESEGLSGTLHLENYSTFQKSIVFTPEELPERDSAGEGKKKRRNKDEDEKEDYEDYDYDNDDYADEDDDVYDDENIEEDE